MLGSRRIPIERITMFMFIYKAFEAQPTSRSASSWVFHGVLFYHTAENSSINADVTMSYRLFSIWCRFCICAYRCERLSVVYCGSRAAPDSGTARMSNMNTLNGQPAALRLEVSQDTKAPLTRHGNSAGGHYWILMAPKWYDRRRNIRRP